MTRLINRQEDLSQASNLKKMGIGSVLRLCSLVLVILTTVHVVSDIYGEMPTLRDGVVAKRSIYQWARTSSGLGYDITVENKLTDLGGVEKIERIIANSSNIQMWREVENGSRVSNKNKHQGSLTAQKLQRIKSNSHTSLEVSVSNKSSKLGFLMSLLYIQQLTGAFISFTQLSKIAGLLNLSSVEPYVYDTGLIKGGARKRDRFALNLSAIYDHVHMKKVIESCTKTELKTFENFVYVASRNVLLVSFVTFSEKPQQVFPGGRQIIELDCDTYHSMVQNRLLTLNKEALPYTQNGLQTLNDWASTFSDARFECSGVVLLDAQPKHAMPLTWIVDALGTIVRKQAEKFGSATLVLDIWRGIHSEADSNFFYYVPRFNLSGCSSIHTIKHSEGVVSATNQFVKQFSLTRPAIGVHVRGERLMRDSDYNAAYSIDCMKQLRKLLQSLTSTNRSMSVYIFHDLGEYGSISCSTSMSCFKARRNFVSNLKKLGYPVITFDPTKFKPAPKSRAFAAFVEREYLANVDDLVTVGRGGFQNSIVDRFLTHSTGNQERLHRICQSMY